MKITYSNVDGLVDNLNPYKNPVLFYGPDEGLVSYRSKKIIKNYFLKEKTDELKVLDFKEKKEGELEESFSSTSLFSEKKVIKITNVTESISKYFDLFDSFAGSNNVFIILLGGELGPRSKLRKYFEDQNSFAAVPCYKIDSIGLRKIIKSFISENKIELEEASVSYLVENLGDNYQIIINELQKLLLLNTKKIPHQSVERLISSYSSEVLENIVFNCLEGKRADLINEFNLNVNDTITANFLLYNIKNLLLIINKAIKDFIDGNLEGAVNRNMPKYLFRKKSSFAQLVKNTNEEKIASSLEVIMKIELKLRSEQNMYKAYMLRGLLNLSKKMK